MKFVWQHLTGGFSTKKKTSVSKSDIVAALKQVLQHDKNVKNVNANKQRR